MTIFRIDIAEKVLYSPRIPAGKSQKHILKRYIPPQKSLSLKVSFAKAASAIHQAKIGSEVVSEESTFLKLPTISGWKLWFLWQSQRASFP